MNRLREKVVEISADDNLNIEELNEVIYFFFYYNLKHLKIKFDTCSRLIY